MKRVILSMILLVSLSATAQQVSVGAGFGSAYKDGAMDMTFSGSMNVGVLHLSADLTGTYGVGAVFSIDGSGYCSDRGSSSFLIGSEYVFRPGYNETSPVNGASLIMGGQMDGGLMIMVKAGFPRIGLTFQIPLN